MGIRWNRQGHTRHKVKEQDWIRGELMEKVTEFDTLADAHEYARNSSSQTVKLYDGWDQLLMQSSASVADSDADSYSGYTY
jgi:hypothetical protein